ncbi:MAG: tRNA uridine-5-carboxymethylaminomethyl(34) synthesis GTPase MnmE [Bacteroidales bacterium]|nr:tRNA uridine-5-carboxymethylaminomethyl(34) synthesis GTPase MnmE [Bacteroidales bacterium]
MRTSFFSDDTICAVATPPGIGAIAVVRLSGPQSHEIVCKLFCQHGKPLAKEKIESHRCYYGHIVAPSKDGAEGEILDEVLVTFFVAPHSFTGEDSVEISVHGSVYVQQRLLELLVEQGARLALAGEYTRRAFVNRKFDLAQAEAVADIIASQSEADHRLAMNQLRGGFSKELQSLRSQLLEITSLIELELDFSEEDVEFADRSKLKALLQTTQDHIGRLTESFRLGNAIKNGIPVAIVGATNTGKSTLLNALLQEDRAIVSDIAGTTRDSIEEVMNLDGTLFRFIDTAGIRETDETIEKIGIERTYRKINEADIVLGLIDMTKGLEAMVAEARFILEKTDPGHQTLVLLLNKSDRCAEQGADYVDTLKNTVVEAGETGLQTKHVYIQTLSAKTGKGMDQLRHTLVEIRQGMGSMQDATLVTNVRHYEALRQASDSLAAVSEGLEQGIPSDLVAQDLREALYYLGTITGEITTDEVLGSIFSRFCIGK